MSEAWFSALGKPLGEEERLEVVAYLDGLGLPAGVRRVKTWQEARAFCSRPAHEWWRAEETARARLEKCVRLDPADRDWLALNDALHGAAAAAAVRAGCTDAGLIHAAAGAAGQAVYHARLARAAGAPAGHPFLRKYALYCGGRWPLGVYDQSFSIF